VGPRSWCHHSIFHVAEVGGEPAAALAGFHEEGDGLAPSAAVLPDVARARGWSDERIASGLRRLAVFVGCLPKDDPRAWSLEWVATLPAFRRRGLVDRLLDVALEAGRRRGHGAADLLILSGNEPARCAYEKHGFRIVDEAHTPEFEAALGCPGLALMRADL
jgi:translation initiation factor 4G